MFRSFVVVLGAAAVAACGSAVNPLCKDVPQPCVAFDVGTDAGVISSAFAQAAPSTTFVFAEGTFAFTSALDLGAVDGVTVRGAGMDKTVLDFGQQQGGADAIFANQPTHLSFEGFSILNAAGNGIRVTEGDGVFFRKLKITWDATHTSAPGAYGLYPVLSRNLLLEDNVIEKAEDAGICVSQGDHAIVRGNQLTGNVAGLIVRSGYNIDIHDNTATGNAAGIVVPTLPGDDQLNGRRIRIVHNTVTDNNRLNDADAQHTVSLLPSGTGILVLGNREVEVSGNTVTGNNTSGVAVVSFLLTGLQLSEPGLYPFPGLISVHDNTFSGNGTQPDLTNGVGLLLYSGTPAWAALTGGSVPDLIYDGIVDPLVTGPDGNPMQVCFHDNGAAVFANLHADQLNADGTNLADIATTDAAPYDCTLLAVDPIVVPGA